MGARQNERGRVLAADGGLTLNDCQGLFSDTSTYCITLSHVWSQQVLKEENSFKATILNRTRDCDEPLVVN